MNHAEDATSAAPNTGPAWETPESRWLGWEDFCLGSPTAVQQLAIGDPLSRDDWLMLRLLQQPATAPDQSHRYLPGSWSESSCWACAGPEDAHAHRFWSPSPAEAQPAAITLREFAVLALEASCEKEVDSPRGLWLRARYITVMQALSLEGNLLGEAMRNRGEGEDVPELAQVFASICDAYQRVQGMAVAEGVFEVPEDWDRIGRAYEGVHASRLSLTASLESMAAEVAILFYDARRHASTTTSVLWAAGIPLAEATTWDEATSPQRAIEE